MWPSHYQVHQFVRVLEKPITDFRNPIWSWEWAVKAFLSHFAMGYLLGLLITLLVLFVARWLGATKVSKWDYRRLKRSQQNAPIFGRAWNRIERICLGCRYQSLLLDRLSFAFRVAFFSGAIANLIDADHALVPWGGPDRLIHKPACAVAAMVVVYCFAKMFRCKDEYAIRLYVFRLAMALSIVAHVVEDYTVNWF